MFKKASVAELADALDLGSSGATRKSSTLFVRTVVKNKKMTTTLNKKGDCKRELEIVITKDEFDVAHNDTVKNIQRTIKMPGFRHGKVPASLIIKQYGPSLKAEVTEKLANNSLREFIENNKINILGQPAFTDIKENEDGSQVFTVEFEVIPEFELKDYSNLEIYEPVYRVTDEDIEKEIAFQARRLGQIEAMETVATTDENMIVTVDSYMLNPETKTVIENEQPLIDVMIDFSLEGTEDLKNLLLNAKVGDEIEHFPTNKNGQNFKPEKIVVKKIEKITPAEINDELAKLATAEKFDNLEDFKQEIGFQVQKHWDDQAKQLMEEQVFVKIVELHSDFELPETLVEDAKKVFENSLRQKNPKTNFEDPEVQKYIDLMASKLIRSDIVKKRIIEKEDLKVEDFDYENFVDDFYIKHPEMAHTASKDVMLGHIKDNERLTNNILQKKFIDLLMDFAKTNEISFEEYSKLDLHKNAMHNNPVLD